MSILDRRPTLARWDGEDWEFKWADGCLYSNSHQIRPRLVTHRNIETYLAHYKPKPGDTILEVGAGDGTEVCLLSNDVGADGKVIAIEADPSAFRRLQKQAEQLPNRNVKVLNVAVGDTEGFIDLYVSEPGSLINSIKARVGDEFVTVKCRTLSNIIDDLDIDRVSFMKMNIEGAEYDALVGLGNDIKKIDEMVVSCHDFTGVPGQATYDKVYAYLESQGFQISTLPPDADAPWRNFYIFAKR